MCLSTESRPDANVPVSYCAPYCDPAKSDCAAGEICTQVRLFATEATTVWACVDPLPLSHDLGPSTDM